MAEIPGKPSDESDLASPAEGANLSRSPTTEDMSHLFAKILDITAHCYSLMIGY